MNKPQLKGHDIEYVNHQWVYADTKEPTINNPRRCGYCNKDSLQDDFDGCIGLLPNVMNACCGHGIIEDAYIQYWNGCIIRGEYALNEINKLKRTKK